MTYIGSFAPVNTAYVVRKGAPAKTPEEMKKTTDIVGCTGVNRAELPAARDAEEPGGPQVQSGAAAIPAARTHLLALSRGEVDLVSSAWNSLRATHKAQIDSGEMIPVIQSGLRRIAGAEGRAADAGARLRRKDQEDPGIRLSRLGHRPRAPGAAGRSCGADRRPARSFRQDGEGQDFLAAAQKRGAEIDPTPGAEVQKYAQQILDAPPDLVKAATAAMK